MSLVHILSSDFCRYNQKYSLLKLLYILLITNNPPGLKYTVTLRLCQYFRKKNKVLAFIFFRMLKKLKYRFGYDISYRLDVDEGLYIGHIGTIVIHGDAKIGKNCNLSQNVTIGILNSGKNKGTPTIGDNVFIGPGACVFGNVTIGDNVTIGANSVVSHDVPSFHTVVCAQSTIIDKDLSSFYIQNKL